MANNLFANVPAACVAKQTISFAAAGFNSSNCYIVYEVGSPLKSWDPSRTINAITGFIQDKGYYIVPKITMDMEAVVAPPLPTGGTGAPAAPTGGTVNDSADTFGFTLNPLFTLGEHEYSLDWGGTWSTVTANPIAVGNIAAAAGQVRVRVKAIGGNPASTALANATEYTVAGGFNLKTSIPWDILWDSDASTYSDFTLTPATDGGTIAEWRDQKHLATGPHPNNWDMQQSDPAHRPIYRATGMNGHPCTETSYSAPDSKFLGTDVLAAPLSLPISIYKEAVKTGALVGGHAFLSLCPNGYNIAINGGTGKLSILDGVSFRDTTFTPVDNAPFALLAIFKTDNTVDVWVNNVKVGNALALSGTTTLTRIFMSSNDANVWPGRHRHHFIRTADLTTDVANIMAAGMADLGI